MTAMANLSINQKKCMGCGLCASCIPDLFKIDENDLKAKLNKKGNPKTMSVELSKEQSKQLKEIIENCPNRAIKLSK